MSRSKLVSTRRSTVLSLPLQLAFPVFTCDLKNVDFGGNLCIKACNIAFQIYITFLSFFMLSTGPMHYSQRQGAEPARPSMHTFPEHSTFDCCVCLTRKL